MVIQLQVLGLEVQQLQKQQEVTFATGYIIQISGTVGNDTNLGLFEVETHNASSITISTTSDFCQTAFIVDTTTGAVITS